MAKTIKVQLTDDQWYIWVSDSVFGNQGFVVDGMPTSVAALEFKRFVDNVNQAFVSFCNGREYGYEH